MDVIATHENADFDGIASLVAARHLYHGSSAVSPTLIERGAREYVHLYSDQLDLVDVAAIDLSSVRRLVVVDTSQLDRLGRLSALMERDEVEIVILDHHASETPQPPDAAGISSNDGALVTTLLGILRERSIDVSPDEATLFALGIHHDTGSLTYESTTARDADALAYCYRHGADPILIERYTRLPLGPPERELLQALLAAIEPVAVDGTTVQVTAVECESFPDGAAQVVDKLADLTEARALVTLLEHDGKTSCIVRSRGSSLDAGALARELGGGGHLHAAAARMRAGLSEARARLVAALPDALQHGSRAEDLMSSPVTFVTGDTSVKEAMIACRRRHVSGLFVGSSEDLVGVVGREDLDGALAHGLGHAPVRALMSAAPPIVQLEASKSELTSLLGQRRIDRVGVESDGEIVGIVTRRDLLGADQDGDFSTESGEAGARVVDVASRIAGLPLILDALDGLAQAYGRIFLVGGGVRDTLLGVDVVDIDVAVEGAGTDLAQDLADQLGGRATLHGDFGTATVTFGSYAVDVASTRSELYPEPAALPTVESAEIESDLFRRDFTINAMAIALSPEKRGVLVDPFGGERDLASGTLRVLHNLSFVDDPTRLLRAARYESRYGFRLDERSEALARACVKLGLVANLSPPRVGNELVLLLGEANGVAALERLAALGVAKAVHPQLDVSSDALATMRRAETLRDELGVDTDSWRLRLAVLTRALTSSDRYRWLESLQLARRDVETVAKAASLAPSLMERSDQAMPIPDLHGLLSAEPIEAVLLALAGARAGSQADDSLRRFLTELRHVKLEIDGDDLAALGLAESPAVGHVLDAVLALKLGGSVTTRRDELDAAGLMIRSREPA